MTLSSYLLFLAAIAILIATPGPTMLMCVTNAIDHGARAALASAAGALGASLGIMALSALGLGALLAASEAAFTVLKVAGAAYLVWLGIRTLRGAGTLLPQGDAAPAARSFFLQGLLVGASNPKALLAPLLRRADVIRAGNRTCGGLFTLMGGVLLLARRQA